ncbi:DUF4386 domain-containing protein [uncultured Croceitalea sp.]|uniref:DUF4386 domain-containing protein n=1 Tax=uncultured Croceitalea sp. TaxID=1798908 RepID=UPI00330619F4
MKSTKKDARIAGLLYLITVLSGVISLVYVPSELIVWDNAAETYNSIVSNESLFKLGILSDVILYTTFIFLSLALYKLLRRTNENIARTMVILVLISVPISFVNLISKLDILSLINEAEVLKHIDLNLQYSQMMALLESHNNGILLVEIFWGLWLFPFGYLVYKSGIIPKIMGVFLMIACFGYLADFLGYFLFPEDFGETVIPTISSISQALGEMGICLWLLIMGAKEKSIL